MKRHFCFSLVIASALLFLGLASCEDDKNTLPITGCRSNSDCGPGYICKDNKECVCVNCQDGDQDPELFDLDEEVIDSPPELPDDVIEQDNPKEQDHSLTEEEEEQIESDYTESAICDKAHLAPECKGELQLTYCRQGTTESVMMCRGDWLYLCEMRSDCTAPVCGFYPFYIKKKDCTSLGHCTVSEDPTLDDHCALTDGDLDDAPTEDDSAELDLEPEPEREYLNHSDGYPCHVAKDCLPGHYCLRDWDDVGLYCSADTNHCVDHVGLGEDDKAIMQQHGRKICHNNTHKRCSSGQWIGETECANDTCANNFFQSGQTCEDIIGCTPTERPEPYACPNFLTCEDSTKCYSTCTEDKHCLVNYKCVDSLCKAP